MFAKLWNDEAGLVAVEYLFLVTIVGLALVVGFSSLAQAINIEYTELSSAILSLNQSYSYDAASGCAGSHGGAVVTDTAGTASYSETAGTASNISIASCP